MNFFGQKKRLAQVMLIGFLSLIAACDSWPPYHEDLEEIFVENRNAFEELRSKILSTKYNRVSIAGIVDSNMVELVWEVDKTEGRDYLFDRKRVEDPDWYQLLSQARVSSVEQIDGVVNFGFGSGVESSNKDVYADYTHSQALLSSRVHCQPDHKKVPCGLCAVPLDDAWYIEYWWFPLQIVPGGFDLVLDGKMTEEDYEQLYDDNQAQCWKDGLIEMGYDPADVQGDDLELD